MLNYLSMGIQYISTWRNISLRHLLKSSEKRLKYKTAITLLEEHLLDIGFNGNSLGCDTRSMGSEATIRICQMESNVIMKEVINK